MYDQTLSRTAEWFICLTVGVSASLGHALRSLMPYMDMS